MADINIRKLPAGIQSFKTIREEGYVYVDKSDIVWYLANCGKLFNYLSRPRRFGKSVLVDTLQMYFEGRKELFEGLKIMQLEKEWKQYPVIRLDLSRGGANAETLRSYLDLRFKEYEKKIVNEAFVMVSEPFSKSTSSFLIVPFLTSMVYVPTGDVALAVQSNSGTPSKEEPPKSNSNTGFSSP